MKIIGGILLVCLVTLPCLIFGAIAGAAWLGLKDGFRWADFIGGERRMTALFSGGR